MTISPYLNFPGTAEAAFNLGGKIEMELQDTFWGAYYGSFSDKFGVQWMGNYDERGKV
jgi:uncharacterized glyoxalase superfamily protein PhnB